MSGSEGLQQGLAVELPVLIPVEVGPLQLLSPQGLAGQQGQPLQERDCGEECQEHQQEPHSQENLGL